MDPIKEFAMLLMSFNFIFVLSEDAPSYCPDVPNKADSTFTIESTCYHLVQNPNSPATRDFARSDCQSRKGRLLTIKTDQIQRNIKNAINRMSDSHTVLLGLMKESYQWKWMDGEPVTYNNWKVTPEPQPGECGRLNVMEGGLWEKVDCSSLDWFAVYICEHNKNTQESLNDNVDGGNSGDSISSKYSAYILMPCILSLVSTWFAHH